MVQAEGEDEAGVGSFTPSFGMWQPIETAPKNGPILGWSDEGVAYVCWHFHGSVFCFYDSGVGDRFSFHPTHWMPLPAPPSNASTDEPE